MSLRPQDNLQAALERQRRRNRRLRLLFWLLIVLILLSLLFLFWRGRQATTSGEDVSGRALVLDGDTLQIEKVKVRLYGIDAPEHDQTCKKGGKVYRCGQEAANALAQLIGQNTVSCLRKDTDRYGRLVGVCQSGRTNLNAWLVESGYALAYREYSTNYVPNENRARQKRVGLHAGTYVEPWNYRKGETTPATPTPAPKKPYPSCAAAKAAGKTPVLRGEPGYNPKLDGDRDGKMCE